MSNYKEKRIMNGNCIYLDGPVMYIFVSILLLLGVIALFCIIHSIGLSDENCVLRDKLRKTEEENEDLRDELSKTQQKLYSKQYTDSLKSLEVE
jgi:predicted nuclease with TOPRIM domain